MIHKPLYFSVSTNHGGLVLSPFSSGPITRCLWGLETDFNVYNFQHWSLESFLFHVQYLGLLIKCEAKMDEYWPSSFFSTFMDRHGVKVNKLAKKLNKAYIQACWLSKLGQNFFLAGHGRQDRAILPAWVAIHRAGFGLSCILTELAIHV